MSITKRLLGMALAIALAVSQVTQVAAAPQPDPIVGTIDSITEDTSVVPSVIIVGYTDTDTNAQSVELTLDEAEALGLVSVDETTEPDTVVILVDLTQGEVGIIVDDYGVVTVDLTNAVFIEQADACEGGHPVAAALCGYFEGPLGVDYETIAGWHEDGFGLGVVAQALFMAKLLSEEGEAVDPQLILDAKKGDWSELGLPEDVNNWGRLRKYAMGKEVDKSLNNLGAIMSGHLTSEETPTEEPPTEETTLSGGTTLSTTIQDGKGYGKGGKPGKGGGNGKGKGH
ncbi:MAG: hypothetical protein V1755_11255 [Chloroflexota bacterium]